MGSVLINGADFSALAPGGLGFWRVCGLSVKTGVRDLGQNFGPCVCSGLCPYEYFDVSVPVPRRTWQCGDGAENVIVRVWTVERTAPVCAALVIIAINPLQGVKPEYRCGNKLVETVGE